MYKCFDDMTFQQSSSSKVQWRSDQCRELRARFMNQMFCEAGPGLKAQLKYARVQRAKSSRKMPAQALNCSEADPKIVSCFFRVPPSNRLLWS